jgi:hypothetical protein
MRLHILLSLVVAASLAGAQASTFHGRWVGTHNNTPLHLDFYGDTMVVVNDAYPASYQVTYDSLVVSGDTAFAVSYWFSLDRLLLRTMDGKVVTMSRQDELARPIQGVWRGSPVGNPGRIVEMQMARGGIARRRSIPGEAWVDGEWSRRSRTIQFTWMPDSLVWVASYDALGQALLFNETDDSTGTLVLRKVWR